MNYFIRGFRIIKEMLFISGLAVADFFFNFAMFIAIVFMALLTIVFYLIALAFLLSAG